jgi:DNA-binding MarR family transcriptional regulator
MAGNARPVPASSKQRLRLWLRLLGASRAIESDLRERLRTRCATTMPRFDVLAALYAAPSGLRMNELSKRLKVSNGNVTGIVERLVADGLVLRSTITGDRRALLARLTPRGRKQFAQMAAHHQGWVDEILSVYDDVEIEHLLALLDKLTN